jgi:hypothetical protein
MTEKKAMTKKECIERLGDCINLIDVQRGSLSPGIPRRVKLDEFRGILDDKQRKLIDLVFNESTEAYKAATDKLKVINDDIRKTINDVNKVAETFAVLEILITGIDDLFMLATGIG